MIKRKLEAAVKQHLDKPEISLIVGPRQVGKTTLMLGLREELDKYRKPWVWLNLDIETDRQWVASQEKLVRKIALEIGKGPGYVFIDEIQRKEDAGLFLKGIYDMNLSYKFIVSGSGSLELKEKIHESLVGRKRVFELNPISLGEFINFKTDYRYEQQWLEFLTMEIDKLEGWLGEYLSFGGYPRVVLAETAAEKNQIMGELYQSYLEKDIGYWLGVEKTEDFTALVKTMASQVGKLVNISELATTLGISAQTVKKYLWYLQRTFILKRVTPYFKNVRKEITKSPVVYFYDLGMRNYGAGGFGREEPNGNRGFIFQNLVFNLLQERLRDTSDKIHFWRTKDKAEVDFVIDGRGGVLPVEVKYSRLEKTEVSRSLGSFLEKYRPQTAWVVHLGQRMQKQRGETQVIWLPVYELLVDLGQGGSQR